MAPARFGRVFVGGRDLLVAEQIRDANEVSGLGPLRRRTPRL